jgi:hypothetical protein
MPTQVTNANGYVYLAVDTGYVTISPRSSSFFFSESEYTIHVTANMTDTINCASTRPLAPTAAPGMCLVDGYLTGSGYETGDSLNLCAWCDIEFELLGLNCTDTSTASTSLVFDPVVKATASAGGYFSAQLRRTDQLKCDGSQAKWRMTVYRGNRKWTAREFTFYTDTTHVDVGSVLK